MNTTEPDKRSFGGDVVVRFENLCKSYYLAHHELKVLKNINLDFHRGEYVAIMGPSGSGKSTLLNLLGCLDRPTAGTYRLDGLDISQMDDDTLSTIRGKRIGFIFQSFNLIPQLNILENIEVPMYYQQVQKIERSRRAEELAQQVGLSDRLTHRPSELSGGQQQRVAIARALANDPVILLADEPTGNLDSKSGKEILTLLDRLHQAGKTIIVVTHDRNVASRTQRCVHMLDGMIDRQEIGGVIQ
jgi:putative ABC transport system ATP-binding protein